MDNIIFMSEIVETASNLNNTSSNQISNIKDTSLILNNTLNILNKLNNTINADITEIINPRQEIALSNEFNKNEKFVNNIGTGAAMIKINLHTSNSEKPMTWTIYDNTIADKYQAYFTCDLRYNDNGIYWFGPIPIVENHTYSFLTFKEVLESTTIQFCGQKIKQNLTLVGEGSAI